MAGVTVADAPLAATFHCEWQNISRTNTTLLMSTIAYSSPTTDASRALITTFCSRYNAALGIVSAFTRSGETEERSRFEAPPFPQLGLRCTGFEDGNNLKSLLANTAAEVCYFTRGNLPEQPLRVTGRYVPAVPEQDTGRGTIVKVVLVDSRIKLLESKPGEYIHITNGNIRYTRLDKYERTNIQSGTFIVYVTMADPFPVQQRVNFPCQYGQYRIPRAMARNIRIAYGFNQLSDWIRKLLEYIDLCTNPIVEGLPDQADYLNDVFLEHDMHMVMEQVVIALDIYDPVLLRRFLYYVGVRINVYLIESLPSIASHLEFTEAPYDHIYYTYDI